MTYEFAHDSDGPQIKKLLLDCDLPYEDITLAHLQHFLVVRDSVHLAGVIGVEMQDVFGLLRSLAVAIQYRGKRIASELTARAEEYARCQNVETLYLLTTTAERFFAKRGYSRVERNTAPAAIQETTEFQSLCPASAVCMVKHLDPARHP